MLIVLRPIIALALSTLAWATALATFVCDLTYRLGQSIRETLVGSSEFIPRMATHLQPTRQITMMATALNDRQVGGVKIHGFLGHPAVRTLTG